MKVIDPGRRKIRLEPHLADLEWAEDAFPAPYGVVKVRHVRQPGGTIHTTCDAPPEVTIIRAKS